MIIYILVNQTNGGKYGCRSSYLAIAASALMSADDRGGLQRNSLQFRIGPSFRQKTALRAKSGPEKG